jgi:hypothetical protein
MMRGRGRWRSAGLAAHGGELDAREAAPPPLEPPGRRFLGVDSAARTEANCRQLALRARRHVQSERPR